MSTRLTPFAKGLYIGSLGTIKDSKVVMYGFPI